jgi:hypothetical protein
VPWPAWGSCGLVVRLLGGDDGALEESFVRINDPMYLTPAPGLPAPFNTEPMFVHLYDVPVKVEVNDRTYEVITRYSIAGPKTIELAGRSNRGDTAYPAST